MYLHDVLLLVLDDIVHALLRRLVRVSELLLCLNHPGALKKRTKILRTRRRILGSVSPMKCDCACERDLGVLIEDLEKPDED